MKQIIIFAVILTSLSCRQASAPDSTAHSFGLGIENKNKIILDSTLQLIDSCSNNNYKVIMEEYINQEFNSFKLTLYRNNKPQFFKLNLTPGKTNIQICNHSYIVLSSACGGPCYGTDFIFLDSNRVQEGYMFSHIAENNENIITHHKDEEFETILIRNLINSKEIAINIGPCENNESYPCGIKKMKVEKNILLITFDSPSQNPRVKEISINEIL
jgi:hypothetical protein